MTPQEQEISNGRKSDSNDQIFRELMLNSEQAPARLLVHLYSSTTLAL